MPSPGERFDRDRPVLGRWRRIAILLLPATLLLQWLASFSPTIVERVYARGVYPVVARIPVLLTGWLPFSVIGGIVLGGR